MSDKMRTRAALPGNVVRLPRRRRKTSETCASGPAELVTFPDRLGLEPPPIDPTDSLHVKIWALSYDLWLAAKAREAPDGHPLRTWHEAKIRREFHYAFQSSE